MPAGREAGPGRIDAVGHILNEVFGHQYGDPNDAARPYDPNGSDPASIKPIQVPVSVPAVWNAARLQCVQTNCLTSNSLTRNVGEVLGVFGDSETYKDPSGRWRVRSTAKVKNLYALEEALDWVESPKWSPKFPSPTGKPGRGRQSLCHPLPTLSRTTVSRQVQCAVGRRRRELERQERPERSGRPLRSGGLPWPDPIRVEGHQGRL